MESTDDVNWVEVELVALIDQPDVDGTFVWFDFVSHFTVKFILFAYFLMVAAVK